MLKIKRCAQECGDKGQIQDSGHLRRARKKGWRLEKKRHQNLERSVNLFKDTKQARN